MKIKSLQEFLFLQRIPISFYLWYFTGEYQEIKNKINPPYLNLRNLRLFEQLGLAIETKNNSIIEILFYIVKEPEYWIDLIRWDFYNEKHPWLDQEKWIVLNRKWKEYIKDTPDEYIKIFNPEVKILNKNHLKIKRRKL